MSMHRWWKTMSGRFSTWCSSQWIMPTLKMSYIVTSRWRTSSFARTVKRNPWKLSWLISVLLVSTTRPTHRVKNAGPWPQWLPKSWLSPATTTKLTCGHSGLFFLSCCVVSHHLIEPRMKSISKSKSALRKSSLMRILSGLRFLQKPKIWWRNYFIGIRRRGYRRRRHWSILGLRGWERRPTAAILTWWVL